MNLPCPHCIQEYRTMKALKKHIDNIHWGVESVLMAKAKIARGRIKKISVDLDEEIVEKIEQIAKKNFRSFSSQVRLILTNYKEG